MVVKQHASVVAENGATSRRLSEQLTPVKVIMHRYAVLLSTVERVGFI
jgi:hypothetical protein